MHLHAVRVYLGEYVEPVVCDLDEWAEVVASFRGLHGYDRTLMLARA